MFPTYTRDIFTIIITNVLSIVISVLALSVMDRT
nr:MAG TPA: hypothetical protein [Caudoviricetes sp.]